MAGRPKKVTEVLKDTQEGEILETVEEVEQTEVIEVADEVVLEQPQAPTEAPSIAPIVSETAYQPKDIVEFYNLRGELRYAPYTYITKRGYKALRKYTKKK